MEPGGKKETTVDETRCVRCGIPTAAMCPRCRKRVCIKGACNEAHDMKCPPAGGGTD
jgi:hypothetical protein